MHPLGADYKKLHHNIRLAIETTVLGTILGFFGQYLWLFDLFAHFRLHYAAVFALLTIWLAYKRAWAFALTALLGFSLNLAVMLPYYQRLMPPPAASSAPSLKIISANLLSLPVSPSRVHSYLATGDIDLAILNEISPEWEAYFKKWDLPFAYQVIEAQADNFGIALLSRWPLEDKRIVWLGEDMPAPSIMAKAVTPLGTIQIIATHPPPPLMPFLSRWRNNALLAIADILLTSPIPVLVAGDLNATPWSYPLNQIIALPDVKGGTFYGTWPSVAPLLGVPIDHILVTGPYAFASYHNGPLTGSDHMPLEAVLVRAN